MSALTVQGVADRWETSRQQIYEMIHRGDLKAFCIGSKRGYRVSVAECERWEAGGSKNVIAGTDYPSDGEEKHPLPAGAMKALASQNG